MIFPLPWSPFHWCFYPIKKTSPHICPKYSPMIFPIYHVYNLYPLYNYIFIIYTYIYLLLHIPYISINLYRYPLYISLAHISTTVASHCCLSVRSRPGRPSSWTRSASGRSTPWSDRRPPRRTDAWPWRIWRCAMRRRGHPGGHLKGATCWAFKG